MDMKTHSPCPVCSHQELADNGRPRVNENFPRLNERNYHIVRCRHCRFLFIDPEIDLSPAEWRELYKQDYFAGSVKSPWQIRLNNRELNQRLALIGRYRQNRNPQVQMKEKLLDLGCGQGYMLEKAASAAYEPYGLDLARNLEPCFENRFPFFEGSLAQAAYPDAFFSVVYMDSVMEHVPHPADAMKEIFRILKPGGLFLMIVPNEDCLMNGLIKWVYTLSGRAEKYGKIKPFVTPYHIQGFNRKSLRTLSALNGMSVLSLRGFGGSYPFWKAFPVFSKSWWINLAAWPFGLMSVLTRSQVQLMLIARKDPPVAASGA